MFNKIGYIILAVLLQYKSIEAHTIKLVAGDAFPPLMWNDQGTAKGIAVEIGKAVFKKAGFDVVVVTCPWLRCQAIAENEGAFLVGFSMNDERKTKFLYSNSYMYDDIVIVTKKGKEFSLDIGDDLNGKVIGAQPGVGFGANNQGLRKGMIIERDSSDVARVKKIMSDRIDGGFFSLGTAGISYSARMAGYSLEDFSILPVIISKDPNYFATGIRTAGASQILRKVNIATKELTRDGTISRIQKDKF